MQSLAAILVVGEARPAGRPAICGAEKTGKLLVVGVTENCDT